MKTGRQMVPRTWPPGRRQTRIAGVALQRLDRIGSYWHMDYVIENLRLRELMVVVNENQAFYEDFVEFLKEKGYSSVYEFITEKSDSIAASTIEEYLRRDSPAVLYDGLLRPYANSKAKWFFLAWLMRDAATQRLQPLLRSVPGRTALEKKRYLLNEIRKFVAPLFPDSKSWEWPAISEVLLARLEGSRRALKGNFFEGIVRRILSETIENHGLPLEVGDRQIKVQDETYDVQVNGELGTILIPVKTRETMGGGHALLFTRDIFKSIMVASNQGFQCVPVVIAESWTGDLEALNSKHYIYIQANPNQIEELQPILEMELKKIVPLLETLVRMS